MNSRESAASGDAIRGDDGGIAARADDSLRPARPVGSPGARRAVVLLSGGLGSHVAAAKAKSLGFALHALTFRYGQRAVGEIRAAGEIARAVGVVDHALVSVPILGLAPSPITGAGDVPTGRTREEIVRGGVSPTYVPSRNAIFLAMAASYAESVGAAGIVFGADADAGLSYPDATGDFLRGMAHALRYGTRQGVATGVFELATPLLAMPKRDVVAIGKALGVDYSLSVSCLVAGIEGDPCGRCDGCVLRRHAFAEAGEDDPRGKVHVAADGSASTPGGILLPPHAVPAAKGRILTGG